MNRATSNRRLLKLADFLEKLPRKRFDYGVFVGPDWEGAQDLSCGTTACALGWAAAMPEFRRLGLHFSKYGDGVILGDLSDFAAGAEIFGLTNNETDFLFSPAPLWYGRIQRGPWKKVHVNLPI